MSPPACFWAGVGALVMLHGVSRDDKRSLALSYDLQLILAPVCLFAFVSLAWRALNSAAHLPYVFAGLSFVMQVQAAACLCGAYLVNSARKRVESGKRGRSERDCCVPSRRPRGGVAWPEVGRWLIKQERFQMEAPEVSAACNASEFYVTSTAPLWSVCRGAAPPCFVMLS